MKKNKDLAQILPHKEPMILIDKIIDYSMKDKWLKTEVSIKESSLFFDKELNGIDSIVGIEYMAQTIGCYAYYRNGEKSPKFGYLLGTRLFNNSIEKFELNKIYTILVKEVFVAEIYSFECFIYNEEDDEIASATLNVYQQDKDS